MNAFSLLLVSSGADGMGSLPQVTACYGMPSESGVLIELYDIHKQHGAPAVYCAFPGS